LNQCMYSGFSIREAGRKQGQITFNASQLQEVLVPGLPPAPQPARLQVTHVILLPQNLRQSHAERCAGGPLKLTVRRASVHLSQAHHQTAYQSAFWLQELTHAFEYTSSGCGTINTRLANIAIQRLTQAKLLMANIGEALAHRWQTTQGSTTGTGVRHC